MKSIVSAIGLTLISTFAVAAQETTTVRPRVISTPTPAATPRPVSTPKPLATPIVQSTRSTAPVLENAEQGSQRSRPVLLGGGQAAPTPTPAGSDDDDDVIRVETNLVTMPVSVLDQDGRFISGLQQRDFQIYDNGALQKVEYFQSVEQPFNVVLLLDVSPSTEFHIEEIQDAAIAFIRQLRPSDRVMVIAFDEHVRVLSQPTNNRQQLEWAIRQAQFGDGTGLYEAVDNSLNFQLQQVKGRKAIVLFTDGVDTTSKSATYQSTVADSEETDTLIYTIRYDTAGDGGWGGGGWGGQQRQPQGGNRRGGNRGGNRGGGGWADVLGAILGGGNVQIGGGGGNRPGGGGRQQDYATGQRYLQTLSQNSGGRYFEASSMSNIDAAFSGIAEELRRQYTLGYYPEKPGNAGERRTIKIRVARPNVNVRAKNYYVVGRSDRTLAGR